MVSRKHGSQAGGAWPISGELLSSVVLAPVLNFCLGVESSWRWIPDSCSFHLTEIHHMVPLEVIKSKVKEDEPVLLLHLLSERGHMNLRFLYLTRE